MTFSKILFLDFFFKEEDLKDNKSYESEKNYVCIVWPLKIKINDRPLKTKTKYYYTCLSMFWCHVFGVNHMFPTKKDKDVL